MKQRMAHEYECFYKDGGSYANHLVGAPEKLISFLSAEGTSFGGFLEHQQPNRKMRITICIEDIGAGDE